MPDFSQRSADIETMDNLSCSGQVVRQTLRELDTINDLLGGNYVTLNGIRKLLENGDIQHVLVADLGCGSGDMLRLIKKWSQKKGIDLELTGIDANSFIIEYAIKHTPAAYGVRYFSIDIFSEEFRRQKFDVVCGTLFFHHFTDDQLISFFAQLKHQVRIGIIINDIHRHWFAYYAIKWLTKLFSKSRMVKYDAPLSVLRAFRKNELEQILINAGITDFTIRWMWAFRWQVIIKFN